MHKANLSRSSDPQKLFMIKVNSKQKGNNVLEYLTKTTWYFEDSLLTDYLINSKTSVLYLCTRFHAAKPEYIHKKFRKLQTTSYEIRILLLYVDIQNYESLICELFSISDYYDHTLILAFSNEEAGYYLQSFENTKNVKLDILRPSSENKLEKFLTLIESVTKRDVVNIMKHSISLKHFLGMSLEEMERIPGIGKKKAQDIQNFIDSSFS